MASASLLIAESTFTKLSSGLFHLEFCGGSMEKKIVTRVGLHCNRLKDKWIMLQQFKGR